MMVRRGSALKRLVHWHFLSKTCNLSSRSSTFMSNEKEPTRDKGITSSMYSSGLHLSPLLSKGNAHLHSCKIETVDDETWRVSSGLSEVWKGNAGALDQKGLIADAVDDLNDYVMPDKDEPDFDEIEDTRVRGNLFYKLDRDSKEYEEYSFDFHRRKSSKSESQNKGEQVESHKKEKQGMASGIEKSLKNKVERKENKMKVNTNYSHITGGETFFKVNSNDRMIFSPMDSSREEKKKRAPTFNQVTAPYHEPFCLDIYISNASVRACIVHRFTCKVVAVAHSISKDVKFDLSSTKNGTACAAVGKVLARRALADDIHNMVYTPRKGEKLEGKLQIVLRSIISNGVDVKVKIKQAKLKNAASRSTA